MAAATLVLAGCVCFHRSHPIGEFPRKEDASAPLKESTPATLGQLIDLLEQRCNAGQPARIGFCAKNDLEYAWIEDGGVVWKRSAAWSVADGKLAYVEKRSWSDVAICLPDVVDRWGTPPPCHPVMMTVCGAIDDLRERYGKPPAPN